MTLQEKIIVSAYTGYSMCDFSLVHKYIEEKMGRPVWTHEMRKSNMEFHDELKKRVKSDFLKICESDTEKDLRRISEGKYTREKLLELPVREWDITSEYDTLTIVPTSEVHDSGYRLMAIVGNSREKGPVEIAAFCDSVDWDFEEGTCIRLRTDMEVENNCCRVHGSGLRFKVGASLSSLDVTVVWARGVENENA